jgi:phosphate/sulfate permease
MHDVINSISTIVSLYYPKQAIVGAFNSSLLIFGTAVAKTIGQGMIDISIVTEWWCWPGFWSYY